MIILVLLILGAVGFGLLSLSLRLLRRPMACLMKLAVHAALGYVFLFVFNFVGAWAGLQLPLNWLTAAVVGLLGVPGVVLLLLFTYIF